MKVTVTKFLNVRVGKPRVNAPCFQFLAPGTELEVDGKFYDGDVFDGSNQWMKDGADNYYWSGGINFPRIITETDLPDYDRFIQTFQGNGADVGIAFLDSGVNQNHFFLKDRVKAYESFIDGKSKSNISSHGNRVAGILSSDDPSVKRNQSNLYCFRVADKNNIVFNKGVEESLLEIKNNYANKIDIINMSLDVMSSFIGRIQPIIDELQQMGIITVVAGGENNFLNNVCSLENVITVSTFDGFKFPEIKSKGLRAEYTVSFFNEPITSYSLEGNLLDEPIGQDSAYTAVVSSILAKHIQNLKIAKDPDRLSRVNTFIKGNTTPISSAELPHPFKMYV